MQLSWSETQKVATRPLPLERDCGGLMCPMAQKGLIMMTEQMDLSDVRTIDHILHNCNEQYRSLELIFSAYELSALAWRY